MKRSRFVAPGWAQQGWVEVDLDAVEQNTSIMKQKAGGARVAAVVKANGAGHGVLPIAKATMAGGADLVCVFNMDEAAQLRQLGFAGPVLVMGYVPPGDAGRVADLDIAVVVTQVEGVVALAGAAAERGVTVAVHVKMDVGMYRAGASEDAAIALAAMVRDAASLRLEGFCTHFPSADEPNADDTERRFARFVQASEIVAAPVRHVANTATLLRFPHMSLEMVRPGAGLYGIAPGVTGPAAAHGLRAVMAWKTSVVQVHDVPVGASVSYGGSWTAARESRVAVVAVGYSDGYRRELSNRGAMLVHGFRAPVVGTVCMDMCLIDVTDGPEVRVGDVVVVVGEDGSSEISLASFAEALGTIPYEVCTSLGNRMARVYFRSGAPVLIQTALDRAPRALTAAEAVVGDGSRG